MENNNYGNQITGGSGNFIHGDINHRSPQPMAEQPTSNAAWKQTALELVARNRLKEALAEIIRANNTEHAKNQVVQLMGRLSKVEMEVIVGTCSKQEEALETNQIRAATVSLISSL